MGLAAWIVGQLILRLLGGPNAGPSIPHEMMLAGVITIKVESNPWPMRSPPSPRISARPRTVTPRGVHEVPHDRRAVMLTLTPSGERIAEEFYAEVSDRLQHLVADLPAADRRRFETIGSKIIATERVPAVFGTAGQENAG